VTNIRAVFDFKALLRAIRPKTSDKDIKTQFSLQFKATEDGSGIQVRTKAAVNMNVDFGPWNVMLPHRQRPDAIPHRDVVPPICPSKQWSEFGDEIVPSLQSFYNNEFRHPVHIPDADRVEMLEFLTRGPAPPAPPGWIAWDDFTPEVENQVVDTVAAAVAAPAAAGQTRQRAWRPFLQPRQKRCRCGSTTHKRITHKDCPMNPSRADPDATVTSTAPVFPFPVGTWVAFEFGDGMFPGKISKLYEGDDLCEVVFTDGDKADYEGDEIIYAAQLYEREFNK